MGHLLVLGTQKRIPVGVVSSQNTLLCSPGIVPWYEPDLGGEGDHEIYLKIALPFWIKMWM